MLKKTYIKWRMENELDETKYNLFIWAVPKNDYFLPQNTSCVLRKLRGTMQ